MEGPLVSDTTELLSSAPGASEGAPVGTSAPSAAGGASTPKSRSRGGTGLSSLLMPELQRIAQSMSIPGAGRMRKGQLIEAIEARQGGAPKQEAGAANQGSNQRVASAGADSTRLRKQDAMEPDTRTQPGIGDGAVTGIGAAARGQGAGIGADGATGPGQQLSFDQAPATDRPNGRSRRTATQRRSRPRLRGLRLSRHPASRLRPRRRPPHRARPSTLPPPMALGRRRVLARTARRARGMRPRRARRSAVTGGAGTCAGRTSLRGAGTRFATSPAVTQP